MAGDPLLDDMARLMISYLGERVKRQNIINQAGANTVYINAHEVAKAIGLSERVRNNLTPFPGTNVSIVEAPLPPVAEPIAKEQDAAPPAEKRIEPTPKVDPHLPARKSRLRRLVPWVISAGLAGGAGVGGYVLNQYFQQKNQPPAIEQRNGEVGVEIE